VTAVAGPLALAESVRGPVLRPDDEGYAAEVAGFNLATTHTPDVVVGATCAEDVAAAVAWAATADLPVAVQATGHGANLSVDHGLLVTTSRMATVEIDARARTATVGAGAKWRSVLDAASPYGLAGLNGSSSDVGVVGYTVGGGLPVLGRTFGYAADRVRSFRVVTGDGRLRDVDAHHEPELFWALRGGKGNVGVVTSMVCGLVPVARIVGGGLYFAGAHADRVLEAYAEWVGTVPAEMCSAVALLRLPPFPDVPEPLRGQFVARVAVAWVGDAAAGARLLRPLRQAAPVVLDSVAEMPYADVDRVYEDPQHPVPAREGCSLLRELTPDAVATLLDQAGPGTTCPLLLVQVRHMGARLAAPPAVEDAISAREAGFLLETIGIPAGPHAAAVPGAIAGLHEAMRPCSTGRTMVNLHGTPGDEADRRRAWTPETYARLRRAKATYDPANLFRFGHAVVPA
jgi:FAD/FMN-containing dehydrogenase